MNDLAERLPARSFHSIARPKSVWRAAFRTNRAAFKTACHMAALGREQTLTADPSAIQALMITNVRLLRENEFR